MPEETMFNSTEQPISATQRIIKGFGDSDFWKPDHKLAMQCYEVEEHLAWGISIYKAISEIQERVQARAMASRTPLSDATLADFEGAFRVLNELFGNLLTIAGRIEREGFDVELLDEFRRVADEVECIVGNTEFESQLLPIEEMQAMLKPGNPRPERYGD